MKSPEDIKLGLECCQTSMATKYKVCSKCGYFDDGYECENALRQDALAYIQQLESQINVLIPEAALFEEAIAAGEKYKRERDAAVKQLKEVDRLELFCCSHCKHEELDDFSCTTCIHMSNWEWIGAQEVE